MTISRDPPDQICDLLSALFDSLLASQPNGESAPRCELVREIRHHRIEHPGLTVVVVIVHVNRQLPIFFASYASPARNRGIPKN